jgi:hypothetical protein
MPGAGRNSSEGDFVARQGQLSARRQEGEDLVEREAVSVAVSVDRVGSEGSLGRPAKGLHGRTPPDLRKDRDQLVAEDRFGRGAKSIHPDRVTTKPPLPQERPAGTARPSGRLHTGTRSTTPGPAPIVPA